jgi:hypothetical protein
MGQGSIFLTEYLAIIMAIDQWHHYLLQNEFIIHTNHRSLVQLTEQRLHTPWQQKAFIKLLGLRYRIEYRGGSKNSVVDAFSHRGHHLKFSRFLLQLMNGWTNFTPGTILISTHGPS